MFITEVDNTEGAKTITIKYPGTNSKADGYKLEVSTTDEGAIDSSALTLTVEGKVTDY